MDLDDPALAAHVDDGRLQSLTGHGELDHPDGCFLRIVVGTRLVTFGLGMSLRWLVTDPLSAGGIVELETTP